jgi:NitT/TauT family transport system substrate-binding protein
MMMDGLKRVLATGALLAGLALAPAAMAADAIPEKPEPGTFKMGIEPWLGYGQWVVADKTGIYPKHGLEKVEITNFVQDKDINAALASGALDGANIATHTAMAMAAAGLPIKIVMLLDVSMEADAIIAGKGIDSVADLKGKEVAYEEGTTSDILLNYALAANGMTIKDVKPVPMPAADAGSALLANQVPAAVTYEPYLTIARNKDKSIKLLFPAAKDPGLISDVFVVREEVLKTRPGQVLALVKAWNDAVAHYRANTKESQAIIAEGVGAKPEELETAFAGVKYYDLAENKKALLGDFATKTYVDVAAAAKKASILTQDIAAKDLIDARFVDAAK